MEAVSSRDRWILRVRFSLCCLFLAASLSIAQYFIPSLRYIILSVPLFPTSYDECSALDEEFPGKCGNCTRNMSSVWPAPPGKNLPRENCSKASCQPYTRPGMMQGKSSVKRVGSDEPTWASIWPSSAGEGVGLGAGTRSNSNLSFRVVGPL